MTLVTLPCVAVTVMPWAGSTSWLPSDGVIFSSEASSEACALADAEAEAEDWAGVAAGAPLLQAVPSRPRAAAAATVPYQRTRPADLRSWPRTVKPPGPS